MDKNTAWTLFESTGNIEAYMIYHDLVDDDDQTRLQEVFLSADKNQRPYYQGY